MTQKMAILKYGDKVVLNDKKGKVGTAGGYAAQYNEDPNAAIERAKRLGHELYWVNQDATVLCGDPGYYERERQKWADAIELEDGQQVWMEGQLMTIHYKGDYSDMGTFKRHYGAAV